LDGKITDTDIEKKRKWIAKPHQKMELRRTLVWIKRQMEG
jgi:hypothetical protein